MCGIAGQFGGKIDLNILQKMGQKMSSRGPDAASEWSDDDAAIGFAHRRLAIVDLSPAGIQPMLSTTGRYVICMNGEIYNHAELRSALDDANGGKRIAWRGSSDVETLLALIEACGLDTALGHVRGMYAFALWDKQDRKLSLVRDRMGEKPLYYGWVGEKFVFASDLGAIQVLPDFRNEICKDAVEIFLKRNYVPAPLSIYQGLYKLAPASILQLTLEDVKMRAPSAFSTLNQPAFGSFRQYWTLADSVIRGIDSQFTDDDGALSALEKVLVESLNMQSQADVPVGAFLSGGIDSSLVVALLKNRVGIRPTTFTIGFEQSRYDEAQYAEPVAEHLGTDHHELHVTPQDAMNVIPELPRIYSEPFADSSQIPTYLVSKLARQKVTVALSGDAGDEMFGGYNRHLWAAELWPKLSRLPFPLRLMAARLLMLPPKPLWDGVSKLPGPFRIPVLADKIQKVSRILSHAKDAQSLYLALLDEWHYNNDRSIDIALPALPRKAEMGDAAKLMYWDAMTYMPDDILCKVDRAAMGVSLETRVPFLDHHVVDTAMRLPAGMRIRNGQTKWALRTLLYRHVPQQLIDRPKAGFGIPVGEWMRGPLRDWAESLLDRRKLEARGVVDVDRVTARWSEHLAGRRDWTSSLWAVLMLQAFLDKRA
jgi:asparagine synthase (glutamine-hydrolysing)